jgi:Tetratricopeptide repeat.
MDLLARIYCQQGRYEKAKDLWERAVELQPGSPVLRRSLARCIAVAKSPAKEFQPIA